MGVEALSQKCKARSPNAPALLSIEIVGVYGHALVQIFLIPAAQVQGDTIMQEVKPDPQI
jgi:hypothetical protein